MIRSDVNGVYVEFNSTKGIAINKKDEMRQEIHCF